VWWYSYHDQFGERVRASTGCELKYDAEEYIKELKAKLEGKEIPSFGEFAAGFFDPGSGWLQMQKAKGKELKEVTARMRQGQLDKYLLPKWKRTQLDEFNPVKFERWLLSLDLSNSTRNQILYTASIILKEAKREGLLKYNPLADAEPLSVSADRQQKEVLSPEELSVMFPEKWERFLQVWPVPMYGIMYALMVSSGLRSGEARGLQWKHIIWQIGPEESKTGAVLVLQAFDSKDRLDAPKKNEKRGVILPGKTMRLLSYWNDSFPDYGIKKDDAFIFTTTGLPMQKRTVIQNLSRGIQRLNDLLKSEEKEQITKKITPHCLRHTYNTMMRDLFIENSIPEDFLRHFTGHKQVSMTDHYDHVDVMRRTQALLPIANQVDLFWKN
jgi:integrase